MRLSLRYRLLVPPAVLLVGVVAGTAWAAVSAATATERRIAGQIRQLAHTLSEPPTFPLTRPVLDRMRGLSGAEFLLVERTGTTITTFDRFVPPIPDVPPLAANVHLGPPVTVGDDDYRGLRVPLRAPHPNEGGELYVFYPESLRRSAVNDAVRPLILLGAAGGLTAVLLAVIASTRLVNRIRELMQRTRDVATGRFEPMPLPRQDDELRELCRSVNDMARQLGEFQASQQRAERLKVLGQFAGGLAHQLRNAAAGARLSLQLYRDENRTADTEPILVALRQLGRIEASLKQFLDLGRPPTATMTACDFGSVLSAVVEQLVPQCRHAGTMLVWNPPGPLPFTGDGSLLEHLFANLIGNAVEAAGPGGTVTVTVTANLVEIADTGPGPPADLAAKLFEPFVSGKPQGVGLGLAVAKQAADAHGMRIDWRREDGRTVFRVILGEPGASATGGLASQTSGR